MAAKEHRAAESQPNRSADLQSAWDGQTRKADCKSALRPLRKIFAAREDLDGLQLHERQKNSRNWRAACKTRPERRVRARGLQSRPDGIGPVAGPLPSAGGVLQEALDSLRSLAAIPVQRAGKQVDKPSRAPGMAGFCSKKRGFRLEEPLCGAKSGGGAGNGWKTEQEFRLPVGRADSRSVKPGGRREAPEDGAANAGFWRQRWFGKRNAGRSAGSWILRSVGQRCPRRESHRRTAARSGWARVEWSPAELEQTPVAF